MRMYMYGGVYDVSWLEPDLIGALWALGFSLSVEREVYL